MREGAKEEAGAGTPGFEGGRTWGPGHLGLTGERVGRDEGLDLRRKGLGTGTLGLWKEGGWVPGLPSSLTLFLEVSSISGKGILLQVQHPE